MKRIHLTAAIAIALFTATSALASGGYVKGNVQMYAGPDYGYPSVFMLSAGSAVAIDGCIDGWAWCDVAIGDNRGWVPGGYLQEEYGGQLVLVPGYGAQIGIPIVAFVLAAYWDDYYRNRPWYGQRERWSHFTPQYESVSSRGGSPGNVSRGSSAHSYGSPHASQTQAGGNPVRSNATSTRTSHSAGSSVASTPQRTHALTARSHPATAVSHSSSSQHSASAPRATQRVSHITTAVSHGPSAQRSASAPRSAQRVASTKAVSRTGGGQDKAKH
jgi:uncharacterized protein YraI